MPGILSRCSRGLPLLVFLGVSSIVRAQTPGSAPLPFTLKPTPAPSASATPPTGTVFPEQGKATERYTPPRIARKLPVPYPEMAHLNRAEGVVRVLFSIDEAGNVTKAMVSKTSGSLLLDAVVKDSNLQRWQFTPATLDGKPVPSTKEEEFEFRLDPKEEHALALKRLALPVGTPDAPYPKDALATRERGSVTVSVIWTSRGLVDLIYLGKSSGSNVLDHAALRWAYENWHVDPATLNDKNKDQTFSKTMNFEPPK